MRGNINRLAIQEVRDGYGNKAVVGKTEISQKNDEFVEALAGFYAASA